MEPFTLPHSPGEHRVENLRRALSQTEDFARVAEIFRQLGDPTRIRIFWLLSHQEECVLNIAALMEMSSPAVSHHLRSLHECGLIESRRDGKEVYYRAADTRVSALLHDAAEQIMEITCPEAQTQTQEDVAQQVHDYLLAHLSERVSIEALARRFLVNPTTLKEAFKRVYGNSIAAHTKAHRMETAARLLREGGKSIAEIAAAVGYESQSRFTAAFREAYGVLPRDYRSQTKSSR